MPGTDSMKKLIFCILVLAGITRAGCGAAAPISTPRQETVMKRVVSDSPSHVLRATHILLIRIKSVDAGEWMDDPTTGGVSRSLKVEATLVMMAKGYTKESAGAVILTTIQQFGTGTSRIAAVPGAWSRQKIEPGKEFVTFAVTDSDDAAEIVRDPACQLAINAGDSLTDVHLAMDTENKPLDLFRAVSIAREAAARISFLFPEYLWAMYSSEALADPNKFDAIASLLEQPRLSQLARGTLISRITTGLTSPEPPPTNQLMRFAIALFHLLAKPEAGSFHENIVGTYLPTVLDLGNPSRRSADKFFEDRPVEKSRAVQIMNNYRGSQPAAPILTWLRGQ
jgi:hypothetical protein